MSDTMKTQIIKGFGTPVAVIDLDIVERNIQRLQRMCDDAGLANRPHIKTHKSSKIAKMQIDAGAQGITCQKLGEAEVMAKAGITDIVIATNLLGASRSGRLTQYLMDYTSPKVCADNPVTLAAYAKAANDAGKVLDVMVECDTGNKRAGVETPDEALALIEIIIAEANLNFAGILYYPPLDGWPATQTFHDAMLKGMALLNVKADIVSTGGTPNLVHLGKLKGATEHRAGTCIFNDRMMMAAGVAEQSDCALNVYTSVVSRAGENRGILDAGSKTLTSDQGGLDGYGLIIEHPTAVIQKFAEEHGFLDLSGCNEKPKVGDVVRVIPNHVCVTVNMMDHLIAIKGDEIVGTFPVEARGMLV